MELPERINQVIESLAQLPGVGRKTAARHCLQMTKWPVKELKSFGQKILNLAEIEFCPQCNFFLDEQQCPFCADTKRAEEKSLCVVESIPDAMAIENGARHPGLYYILGGVLNPLLGVGPEELGLDKLQRMVKQREIRMVVLAVNSSVEGDATCSYIRSLFGEGVQVERIGFGMPMGGSLEHLDALTISKALENRSPLR